MIIEMLEKAIEIEGLVRILREGTPSQEVYTMLARKARELADLAGTLEAKQNHTCQPQVAPETQDPIPATAIEEEKAVSRRMEEAEEMENQTFSEEQPTAADDNGGENAENTKVEIPSDDDDIILTLDEEEPDDDASRTSLTGETLNSPARRTTGITNLKSCFSLNDRFLYARELFDGNMKMFDSTLKNLEGVSDFSAVEDYFYDELEWDRENEHVKSFMDIIASKFN